MEAQHGRDVGVREDVAVEHDHPPAHEVRRVPHPARRTEGRLLDGVGELDAEAAPVAHRAAHLVDHVGAGEHGAVDAVALEQGQLIRQEGNVQQGDDGLGTGMRQRPQPRALAPGQDDGR